MNRKVQIGAAKVLWHFQNLRKREFFFFKKSSNPINSFAIFFSFITVFDINIFF